FPDSLRAAGAFFATLLSVILLLWVAVDARHARSGSREPNSAGSISQAFACTGPSVPARSASGAPPSAQDGTSRQARLHASGSDRPEERAGARPVRRDGRTVGARAVEKALMRVRRAATRVARTDLLHRSLRVRGRRGAASLALPKGPRFSA